MKKILGILLSLSMLLALVVLPVNATGTESGLQPFVNGDRVMFLGDSITHSGTFYKYLHEAYTARYPERSIDFINAGISGDSLNGAIARIESDMNEFRPTKIIIMLGMNDLAYGLYTDEEKAKPTFEQDAAQRLETYKTRAVTLLNKIREKDSSVDVIWLTPTPFDDTSTMASTNYVGYGKALEDVSAWIKGEFATQNNVPVIDLNGPMTAINKEYQKINSANTIISSDRIHPGKIGSYIMAMLILKAQGFRDAAATVEINGSTLAGTSNVSALKKENNTISYTYNPEGRPFYADSDYFAATDLYNAGLNKETIKITNLTSGNYTIFMDNKELGTYTASELAEGVDIATRTNNAAVKVVKELRTLIAEKFSYEFKLRNYAFCKRQADSKNQTMEEYYNKNYASSNPTAQTRLDDALDIHQNGDANIKASVANLTAQIKTAAAKKYAYTMVVKKDYYKLDKIFEFEGSTTGLTSNAAYSTAAKINDGNVENGVESGKALTITPGTAAASTFVSLTNVATEGTVKVSFDLYKPSDSPRIQFYFYSSGTSNNNVVSSPIATSGWIGEHSNNASIIKYPFGKWTHVVYSMNIDSQTFSISVDGTEVGEVNGNKLHFRNKEAIDLARFSISVDAASTSYANSVQIDNLKIELVDEKTDNMAAVKNLLSNSGFESVTNNVIDVWTVLAKNATIKSETNEVYSGEKSVFVTPTSWYVTGATLFQKCTLEPNKYYYLEGYFKPEQAQTKQIKVDVLKQLYASTEAYPSDTVSRATWHEKYLNIYLNSLQAEVTAGTKTQAEVDAIIAQNAYTPIQIGLRTDGTFANQKFKRGNMSVGTWQKSSAIYNTSDLTAATSKSVYVQVNVHEAYGSFKYYADDIILCEIALVEKTNLPSNGTLKVEGPRGLGLAANKVTLSSGTVTGVTFNADEAIWEIAYKDMKPGENTVKLETEVSSDEIAKPTYTVTVAGTEEDDEEDDDVENEEQIDAYVYEPFDNQTTGAQATFFTGNVANTKIELKDGSTTDKVMSFSAGADNKTINFVTGKTFDKTCGTFEVSFDFYRKSGSKMMRFYLLSDTGKMHFSGYLHSGYVSAETMGRFGNTVDGWNSLTLRVDPLRACTTVTLNGVTIRDESGMAKEFTLRNAAEFKNISKGFFNFDADTDATTMLIDNFVVRDSDGNEEVVFSTDFEGASTGFDSANKYFTIQPKYDDGDASNGVEKGKALQVEYDSVNTKSITGTFTEPVTNGVVEASFDMYRPSESTRFQIYFSSKGGKNAVSAYFDSNGLLGAYGNGAITTDVPTNKWVNVKFRFNLSTQTYTVEVDGTEYKTVKGTTTPLYFREKDAVTDIAKATLYSFNGTASATKKVQFDNFKVSTDITNYHLAAFGSGYETDELNQTISLCPTGIKVEEFLKTLSSYPAQTELEIYSADKKLKSNSDIIEKYDFVKVSYPAKNRFAYYTILPDFAIDFRGITIDGNEYFEALKVIEPGTATVRARLENYTGAADTVNVYAAVVGDKLYGIKLLKNISVPAKGNSDVKFELEIPDNADNVKIKLIVVENENGLNPVCSAETKPVATSQVTRMPNVFSDNMVLQRGEPVNIYGMAPTGTEITVTFGDKVATGVAIGGRFCVKLPSMEASNVGKDLVVTAGDTTFTYTNVVVGEVIYGSGQSNMYALVSTATGAQNLGQVQNMRFFTSATVTSTKERVEDTISESWQVTNADNWKNVSATMHTTAYYLRQYGAIPEDVTIGLVNASKGGSSISAWISPDLLETGPNVAYYTNYLNKKTDTLGVRNADLYSGMAKFVTTYTAKVAMWYQGESDLGVASYNWYQDELIKQTRAEFGKKIPYYIVQLPGYSSSGYAGFRLVQWKSHNPENDVHVVVTSDSGEVNDIHPQDKHVIGERLARSIAYNTYGINTIPYQGPVFKSASANGSQVTINFDFVNDGLHGKLCSLDSNNSLTTFEVSTDGTTWTAATAAISADGESIVLTSAVQAPKYVRYGYISTPLKSAGSDSNGVKLPMAPFSEQIK